MYIINLESTKSTFFPLSYYVPTALVQLHACNLQNINLQAETWSFTRAWTSIYNFKKTLTLQKAWEESVYTSRTNSSLSTAISDTGYTLDTHWIHTGNHLPGKSTLCSPECFLYFSLAHLCTWISTIAFIYSSGTRRHSEVYKICLVCCGQSLFSSWVQHAKTLRDTRNRFHSWNLPVKAWLLI